LDVAAALPPEFVAVTVTRSRFRMSAETGTYVGAVASAIGVHVEMFVVLHRSHWYVKLIGCDPVHDPLLAVNCRPTLAWPLMIGREVFVGDAIA
jgi:hypothetical protein